MKSRFVQISDYLLLEYQYYDSTTDAGTIMQLHTNTTTTTTVDSTVYPTTPLNRIFNPYTNENQLLNSDADVLTTNNVRDRNSVKTGKNSFVDLDIDQATNYLDFDSNLTTWTNAQVVLNADELVSYDALRFHMVSGYTFDNIDGFIFEIRTLQNDGKYFNLSNLTWLKSDTWYSFNPTPIFLGEKVYDRFVQVLLPSVSAMVQDVLNDTGMSTVLPGRRLTANQNSVDYAVVNNKIAYFTYSSLTSGAVGSYVLTCNSGASTFTLKKDGITLSASFPIGVGTAIVISTLTVGTLSVIAGTYNVGDVITFSVAMDGLTPIITSYGFTSGSTSSTTAAITFTSLTNLALGSYTAIYVSGSSFFRIVKGGMVIGTVSAGVATGISISGKSLGVLTIATGSYTDGEVLAFNVTGNYIGGRGFALNTPLQITLHQINSTKTLAGTYANFITSPIATAIIPQQDEYGLLEAQLHESKDGDYYEFYPTWNGQPIDTYLNELIQRGNQYNIIHELRVTENNGSSDSVTDTLMYLQASSFNTINRFRPIINDSGSIAFSIDYVVRLYNTTTGIQIVRRASLTELQAGGNVNKYGNRFNGITISSDSGPLKIYNKIQSGTTFTLPINSSSASSVVKYIPSFFEKNNITVGTDNVTIDANGNLTVASSDNSVQTTLYAQGNAQIIVNPYDNYFRFVIYKLTNGAYLPLNLNFNTTINLGFIDNSNKKVSFPSMVSGVIGNLSIGDLLFKIPVAYSSSIINYTNRNFYITSFDSVNNQEIVLYQGKFITSDEIATATSVVTLSPKTLTVSRPIATEFATAVDDTTPSGQVNKLNSVLPVVDIPGVLSTQTNTGQQTIKPTTSNNTNAT